MCFVCVYVWLEEKQREIKCVVCVYVVGGETDKVCSVCVYVRVHNMTSNVFQYHCLYHLLRKDI